jgi:hypothetical protein
LAGSVKKLFVRSRIADIVGYPASYFAKLAQSRLQKYWWQTYAFIAVISNVFIAWAVYIIEPRLPITNEVFLIIVPILVTVLVSEYATFLRAVHKKTVEIYDTGPIQLKLTILSVHMRRGLLTLIALAINFVFVGVSLIGTNVPFLTAGIPYYFTLNATLLLNFRINNNQELDGVFEALPQLNKLSRLYQKLTMRVLKDKIKGRLEQQLQLAGEVNPNEFLRMLYLEHSIPTQPSAQIVKLCNDLKNTLANKGDVFGLLNQKYPKSITIPDSFTFQLPWEKRLSRERVLIVMLSIPEAILAFYQLFRFLYH